MNNKTWWVVGVIAVLVIGGLIYWGMGGAGTAGDTASSTTQQSSGTSLKSLLASGKSEKCTFSDSNDQENSNGVVYISSGKIRGDFQVYPKVATQSVVASHMILMENTSYVWTDQSSQGFKVGVGATTAGANGSAQQSVNLDQQMNYKCEPWAADQNMFKLPTGITFSDMSSMPGAAQPQ